MPAAIQTKPVPYCPNEDCGAQMVLRRPRQYQDWEPFWGCSQYPECKGARDIGEDGKPIFDEIGVDYYQ
jgi:ssDNA-binding Zn-finger/Zn-ribbon topoisomerase 1